MLDFALLLPPEQALEYFRSKGLAISKHWLEMSPQQHAKAFTVARVMALEVLHTIREALDEALQAGRTERWYRQQLIKALQEHGWLPQAEEAGVTMPWRLKTIFRTNLQAAYMAGRYAQQVEMVRERPYWQYIAVLDERTRPAHRALHGLVFPAEDPFWHTHYPPNGYNCRCRVRALTAREVQQRGLQVSSGVGNMVSENRLLRARDKTVYNVTVWGYKFPDGSVAWTDPNWSGNPGMLWKPDLQKYLVELRAAYLAHSTVLGRHLAKLKDTLRLQEMMRDYAATYGDDFASYLTLRRGDSKEYQGYAIRYLDRRYALIMLSDGYSIPQDVMSAMRSLQAGVRLSRQEVNALSVLWHEYRHLQQRWLWEPHVHKWWSGRIFWEMEVLHEYASSYTLNEFVEKLGAAPIRDLPARIRMDIHNSYTPGVARLRQIVEFLGLKDEEVVPVLARLDIEGPRDGMKYEWSLRRELVQTLWRMAGLPLPEEAPKNAELAKDALWALEDAYYAAANGDKLAYDSYMDRLELLKKRKKALSPSTYGLKPPRARLRRGKAQTQGGTP